MSEMCLTMFCLCIVEQLKRCCCGLFHDKEISLLFPDLQPIAGKVPRHGDMMGPLGGVVSCWNRILSSLNVPFAKIQTIKNENPDEYMRLAAGLHVWIATRCSPATWQNLINALSECDLKEAILKVEQRMRAKYKDYITQK